MSSSTEFAAAPRGVAGSGAISPRATQRSHAPWVKLSRGSLVACRTGSLLGETLWPLPLVFWMKEQMPP